MEACLPRTKVQADDLSLDPAIAERAAAVRTPEAQNRQRTKSRKSAAELSIDGIRDRGEETIAAGCAERRPKRKKKRRVRARPMSKADVNNVAPLTRRDALSALKLIAVALRETATDDRGRPTWPDDDIRWNLTPHELQKLGR